MQAWDECLIRLEKDLGIETVKQWLRPLHIIHFDACNLYLEANNTLQIHWFEEQMRHRLKNLLLNNNGNPIKVHLTLANDDSQAASPKKKKKKEKYVPELVPDTLDPGATFESFLFGQKNAVIEKLFQEVLENTAVSFNPIYFYGPPGSGKTHLLMALAQHFKKKGSNALYIRAETFTEHVVNAIRSGAMQEFRKAYRFIDILLIDDIHILAKKNATQEEFFHTFNALHNSFRQIIISANSAPSLLADVEPRLISRFEWGLLLPLEKLSHSELAQVAQNRCKALKLALNEEAIACLVEIFSKNSKSLYRALDALALRLHLQPRAFSGTKNEILQILADLIEIEKATALTPDKIIGSVANFYGIRLDDIVGKSQGKECATPRQIAMFLCRTSLEMPFMKIGDLFSRDHSTVMTSVKLVQKKINEQDKETIYALKEISRRLDNVGTR